MVGKMRKFTLILVTILQLLLQTEAFKVVSYTQDEKVHNPGDSVTLVCQVDSYWEYCNWKHDGRHCNLEWKRAVWNVTKQSCHGDLTDRVSIAGDYEKHQCSIKISDLRLEDAGNWKCEMESYVYGTSSGYKTGQTIAVSIKSPTTTILKPVTSTTEPVTTSTVSTTTATTTTMKSSTTTTSVPVTVATTDEPILANDIIDSHNNESQDVYTEDDEVEALPVSNIEAKEETPIGLIAGVIVSLIAMAIILSVVGVTWYRRRKSHLAIISYLQTERDDAMAANSFLEEAEYHISIIRDPQSLPLQQQETIKTAVEVIDNTTET